MEDPQKRTVTTYGPLADPHTDKTPDQVNESVSCQKSSGEMNIPVIFCFDGNLVRQVRVAAASLLDTRGTVHYHIYCVCTEDAMETESELRAVCERRDPDSELTMIKAPDFFAKSYERGNVTAGTYLRLMLGSLLPKLDRVIYCDIDVLFRDSLSELWQTNLDEMLLGAVRGAVNFIGKWQENERRPYWHLLEPSRGGYINAGILLMNLKEIRNSGMEKIWQGYAGEQFYYQDQDILNITCRNRIVYLKPRWNVQAYMDRDEYSQYVECGAYSQEEVDEALTNPGILHFTADKPWKRYDIYGNSRWWDYVDANEDLKGLFDEAAARRNHGPGIFRRGIRKIRRILGLEI
jgi:lipopolysaccharide biosynthesis glycosyltransferase